MYICFSGLDDGCGLCSVNSFLKSFQTLSEALACRQPPCLTLLSHQQREHAPNLNPQRRLQMASTNTGAKNPTTDTEDHS